MGLLDALRDPQFRSDLGTNARQLGQSASNTIAEGVTMPVDALAWLLRKGGAQVPQTPVGGSDWAKQQGLMADVPPGAPKMAGEALGLLAPMAGTKQGVNALATALRQGGENLAKPAMLNKQMGAVLMQGKVPSLDEFSQMVKNGKLNQASGKSIAGEEFAKTPMDMGVLNNYSLDDIAHFYAFRKGNGKVKPTEAYDPLKEGYSEYVRDLQITPQVLKVLEAR